MSNINKLILQDYLREISFSAPSGGNLVNRVTTNASKIGEDGKKLINVGIKSASKGIVKGVDRASNFVKDLFN